MIHVYSTEGGLAEQFTNVGKTEGKLCHQENPTFKVHWTVLNVLL